MRRTAIAFLIISAGLFAASCSDDGGVTSVDVIESLDGHDRLRTWTEDLLGDEPPESSGSRAEALGAAVAAVVGDSDGEGRRGDVRRIGEVLGATSEVLDDLAASEDGRLESLHHAVPLAWAASEGADRDERIGWILPPDVDPETERAVSAALWDGGPEKAVEQIADRTDLGGAEVIDEVIREVGDTIDVEPGEDLLTELLLSVDRGRS